MHERIVSEVGDQRQGEGIVTIDDLLVKSQELYEGIKRLCDYKHPLDIRRGSSLLGKGVDDLEMGDNSSRTVKAGSITYFFDIKETKAGKPYIMITESRFKGEGEKHRRSSISIFPEHISEFLQALNSICGRIEQPQ